MTNRTGKTQHVAARLPHGLLQRLDAYAARVGETIPGTTFTRADAIRVLLTKALDAEEASAATLRGR